MPEVTRAVVTGLGLILPCGTGRAGADAVFRGESAVALLPDIDGIPDATGARLTGFVPPTGTERADRAIQFAVAAAEEAWAGAGLATPPADPGRVAVVFSLSKGCMEALASAAQGSAEVAWPDSAPDAAARWIARRLDARGPCPVPVTACASGGHAMVWGARMIERGAADIAIVGAAEAPLVPIVLGSYRRMGILATGGEPQTSVRPFSATRRGFALGEGAGALVIESAESAERRGARPLARLAGWACGAHASSLTDLEPDGRALTRLMEDAMDRAGLGPSSVDYVNAHGSATLSNDLAETRAIRSALGHAAEGVSVSATKGSHGHLLGAATAVETVLTVLAMERGEVPPTANLTDPDPAIDLDCTPLAARRRPTRNALKIASGFGGQSIAIALRALTP